MGFLSGIFGGKKRARRDIERAHQEARQRYGQGINRARTEVSQGYEQGRTDLSGGFQRGRNAYDSPNMVASREQLYEMIMGRGGYRPEAVEGMKNDVSDRMASYVGTSMRNMPALRGDAAAPGLLANMQSRFLRGAAADEVSQRRAIDMDAAKASYDAQRYGIDTSMQDALNLSNMYIQEGQGLAGLNVAEGTTMAGLSAAEAEFLANMIASKGNAMAGTRSNALGTFAGLAGSAMQALPFIASTKAVKTDIRRQSGFAHKASLDKIRRMNLYDYRYLGIPHPVKGVIVEDRTTPDSIKAGDSMINMMNLVAEEAGAIKALAEKVESLEAKVTD